MNPWCRLRLAHVEQAPMQQLRRILLAVDQDEQQAIFRGWQRTVLKGGVASCLPPPPVPGPIGHVAQERGLKVGYQRCKLVHGQARQISHVGGMGWKIAIPSHGLCLLSRKAQYNPNRDELYGVDPCITRLSANVCLTCRREQAPFG